VALFSYSIPVFLAMKSVSQLLYLMIPRESVLSEDECSFPRCCWTDLRSSQAPLRERERERKIYSFTPRREASLHRVYDKEHYILTSLLHQKERVLILMAEEYFS
jgi:hypothetical protein